MYILQLNYWRGPIDARTLYQNIGGGRDPRPQDRRPCPDRRLAGAKLSRVIMHMVGPKAWNQLPVPHTYKYGRHLARSSRY